MIPFAVVGSERSVIIDGKSVRGRKTRWGVVNVEDEKHCEFVYLRNFLTRSVLSVQPVIPGSQIPPTGHTYRISSRRLHRSTTRRSAQNNCSRSRSKPVVRQHRGGIFFYLTSFHTDAVCSMIDTPLCYRMPFSPVTTAH